MDTRPYYQRPLRECSECGRVQRLYRRDPAQCQACWRRDYVYPKRECQTCGRMAALSRRQPATCRACCLTREPEPIDEVVVLRAVAGVAVGGLNVRERREAIRILTRRGLSADETALRIGVSPRTVVRHRTRLREATSQ